MFTATVTRALSSLSLDPRGTAPFPRSTPPMLMHKADRLVSSPDWTYEPKWDGFRVIATVRERRAGAEGPFRETVKRDPCAAYLPLGSGGF